MPDIPSGTSTTATISVGDSIVNTLETVGDHDWFRIQLTAGQEITVALNGVTLEDPYLRIYNSAGQLIYENDDISSGVNRNSLISFKANTTGAYYIDVGSWDNGYTGDYQLAVSNFVTPPVATNDEIADQLVEGYWGGDDHHFNVTQGGTITVSLTGLTAAGANLARSALSLWSDIIGVTFREVTSSAQITFDDNEEGAFANAIYSINGITSSATVNVGTDWLSRYGTGINSYAFQTYVHEIGHALGLGHAGNYNGDARYPYDALHLNDSWATSVMSYFDQDENTYFGSQGFTDAYVVAPMVADIIAMSRLYGLSTSTRIGDTTYGYNSTAGRDIFNSSLYPTLSYTIFDNGGIDTMDYSGSGAMQKIDLNAEAFSNVNGRVGNVSIARATIIENAIGGSGPDQIIGNAVDNVLDGRGGNDTLNGGAGNDILIGGLGVDILTGGPGSDTFRGASAAMNGDTITDFAAGDRIVFLDANVSTFNFAFNGQNLTFSGGSMTLTGGVVGTLVATAAAGGVQLALETVSNHFADPVLVSSDFGNQASAGGWVSSNAFPRMLRDINGDGYLDIIGFAMDGVHVALGRVDGSFQSSNLVLKEFGSGVTAGGWTSQDQFPRLVSDVNGDGREDIVAFGQSGVYVALARADGYFESSRLALDAFAGGMGWDSSDRVPRMLADVNGDGRSDVVGFGDGGVYVALGRADGTFSSAVLALQQFGAGTSAGGWSSNGIFPRLLEDVNNDGRADIVAFGSSGVFVALGAANGGFYNPFQASNQFGANVGWSNNDLFPRLMGDVNGDGFLDIVGFGAEGVYVALGNSNGTFGIATHPLLEFGSSVGAGGWTSNALFPRALADVNGDGRDDVVAYGRDGVFVAYGQDDGSFQSAQFAIDAFGAGVNAGTWSSTDSYPRYLADMNNDGSFDIVGFGNAGAYVALSNGGDFLF